MKFNKLLKFILRNYFIFALISVVIFISLIAGYKLLFSKPTYIYAKVKVGQGLWWASTAKPSTWMLNSIKKGDKQLSFTGTPDAEILGVRYYPAFTPMWAVNQYDVYVTVKLKAGYNPKTKTYTFNRSALSVGSPIELSFPSSNITGTVVKLNETPFQNKYVTKNIYLIYQGGYNQDFPYRFDNIKIGDKFYDGEDTVFEVTDKWLEKNIWPVSNNLTAQIFTRPIDTTQNIVVKAKVQLKENNGALYYGEDYKVQDNSFIPFSTNNYFFENFAIRKIED